jgi:hypothetical protein
MPGYLTNRYISLNPAQDLNALQTSVNSSISTTNTNVSNLTIRVTEAEANIDDLSLNIGV